MSTKQKVAIIAGASQGTGLVRANRDRNHGVVAAPGSIKPIADPDIHTAPGDINHPEAAVVPLISLEGKGIHGRFYIGVFAALFAAFAFSLNFIVPFIIGDYSTFDFALVRHVVSALVGLCILFAEKGVMQHLTLRNCLSTIWLAFIGYVGYFLTVTGAAIFAGPVIAPAFLGLVPIVLAIIGNQRQGSLPWRFLMRPLMLVLIGLVLVNGTAFTAEGLKSVRSLWIGMPLALAAVALWVWFAIANQAAIAARPEMPSGVWSALTLVGGGVLMLAFFPIGAALDLFQRPKLGFGWGAAGSLYVWGTCFALLATVCGVWAWNIASRSLPVALTAQLIVAETAFGVVGGLIVHARWPTGMEVAGVAILIAGVVLAIRVFHQSRVRSGIALPQ